MIAEHTHPLWGMPLNAFEVQFVADDLENEHRDKNRVGAESATPLTTERLISLRGEALLHTGITGCGVTVERKDGREGGSAGRTLIPDLTTSKTNAKRLVRELKQPYNQKGERVYCVCRGVDGGKFMIQCDSCKDWYHGTCVDISERQGRAITRYDCLQCVQAKNELMWDDIAHANSLNNKNNGSGQVSLSWLLLSFCLVAHKLNQSVQVDSSKSSSPTVAAIPLTVGRKLPAQRTNPNHNQQSRTSFTSPIAPSINYHSSKKSNLQKLPNAPEPDVGPTSMAWIHDKTRSLVRKSFGQVLRTILDDFSAKGITPDQVHAEEKFTEGTAPPEWLDVTELAGTMEDALFDLTSDGVKGLHRTCGDKYKAKFRSLQFNLKDKKNSSLRTRLLTGRLPASSLVKLEQRDLANDELRARAEAIRLQSIHDAIKPNIVDMMYKKTHKGDEMVGNVSSMAAGGAAVSFSSGSSGIPSFGALRTDSLMDDDEHLMSPVAAVKQSGIAGIMAAVEAAKLAARVSVGPAKVESLDDVLSKMDSTTVSVGEKRRGSAEVFSDDEPAKKSRIDQGASNLHTSGMGNSSSSSWDHLAASDTWAHVDGGEGWIQSPGDVADFKPFASTSNSPSGSPRESSEPLENHGAMVWNGLVRMPQVGKFTGRCVQIAGKRVGSSKALWESILPPTVFIEGRIDVSRTQSYISQQQSSSSKEVIAVEFVAETNVRDAPQEDEGGATEGGFQALLDYFVQRNRYAVIGQKYLHVRDMYLVPVKRGDTLPAMMTVLSKISAVDKCNERDRLFGVLILDKAVFSGSAVTSPASKPSRSSMGKRGPPAPRTAAKRVDTKPSKPATAPVVADPLTDASTSTPWSNVFPQSVQQQPPQVPLISALSTGMSATGGPVAPALALLMQLTRQQQQQQQAVGFGVPSAGTVGPMLVGGGLGIAELLSRIQAVKQQQPSGVFNFVGGSGIYPR
ncbi:transcription factor S-II, central domain-containing protein [Chytriomyces cf. hyalinus JEL632]|nr:transcription factor S-II, central domain-containing protein [Chytriomyces cf. hyalinus JEL632]